MPDPTPTPHPTSPWHAIGISTQGTSHRKANLPCQDALLWRTLPPDRLIAALADGAGSATHAEIGAQLAARTALDTLASLVNPTAFLPTAGEATWKPVFTQAIQAARQAVAADANRLQVPPRELACTLTLVAIAPTLAAAAQIGDGAAIVAAPGQDPVALTRPIAAEHINETTFITSDTALDSAQFAVIPGPWYRAALFSDGLQLLALKLPNATPHPRFFTPLFEFLDRTPDPDRATAALRSFLESPRVTDRADDDLSLLLATRSPALPISASPRLDVSTSQAPRPPSP
jgi:hypothetical protein